MLKKLFAGLTVFTLAILVGVTVGRAYDYTDITYDELVFSVAGQSTTPTGIWFKSDGLVMYVLNLGNDTVYQYDLATAWDPSTATLDASGFLLNVGTPFDIAFSDDGSTLYALDLVSDSVKDYALDTAWDVSTLTQGTFVSNAVRDGNSSAFRFGDDGAKLYIIGSTTDAIYQYTLSTPWDLTTATYDTVSFSVATESTSPVALEFSASGEEVLVFDSSDTIYQYTLIYPLGHLFCYLL
jgi:DNA-binding beta-propeller fold protein YncE